MGVVFAFLGQLLMQSAFFIFGGRGLGLMVQELFWDFSFDILPLLKFKKEIKLIYQNNFYFHSNFNNNISIVFTWFR